MKNKITCYTCKEKFNIFSELIKHRKEKHPSKKVNRYFPECSWGEECLYRHVENDETNTGEEVQAQPDMKFTCKTCNNEFQNKNDMMMHKKREHPNTVNICKDLVTNSCRKGLRSCWFHHDQQEILWTTTRNPSQTPIIAPLLTHLGFPQMPTSPRETAVVKYEPGATTVEHANTEYTAATTADGNNDVRNNEAENLENTNTNDHEIDGVNIWVPKSRFKRQH